MNTMEKALKLDNRNLHMNSFCFTFNKDRNEFISGANDFLMKFLPFESPTARETIDENNEITAIALGKEHLFYSQSNILQMVTLNNEGTYNPKDAVILSTFNSAISFILFNFKFNVVACCSEDSNSIHCIEVSTKKVYQIKTQSTVSIKNMINSYDNDLLLCAGCDGLVSIYQYNEVEGLVFYKSISGLFSKSTIENKAVKCSMDVNKNNICIISGDILLRYCTLSSSSEKVKINSDPTISHTETITQVKWINDYILLTIDSSNRIKVWDNNTKALLFNFTPVKGSIDNLTIYVKEESFYIIYGNEEGSINISDPIDFPKSKSQIIKQKSKTVSNVDSNDFNAIVEEMMEDLNSQEPNQISKKEELKEVKEEDLLNLSLVEDEDGNIRNKEEIAQLKEEKKNDANQFNVNEFHFIKEKLQICDLQEEFMSSRTRINDDNDKLNYLCCNLTGRIIAKQEGEIKAIGITFADTTNKKNINFIDTNEIELACMNNIGALFANTIEELNMDEYEADTRRVEATLEFKNIQLSASALISDWSVKLPKEENPILLAIGADWCCVYTSLSFIRFYSIFGGEKYILSTQNSLITMAGFENYLAIVYHVSIPFSQSQQLRLKILDSNNMFSEVYDGIMPISPDANLIWFGYSEEGIIISYDSFNILRGFFYGLNNNWIPLLDLGEKYAGTNINFWVVGVEDGEVFGIEMKGDLIEPPATPHPKQTTHKFTIPFSDNLSSINPLIVQYYLIQFYEKRFLKYQSIKELRSIKLPEYCLTENLKDESDIKTMKRNNDKLLLNSINEEIIKGNHNKVIIMFDYLLFKKSKDLAISICSEYKLTTLTNYLTYKLRLYQLNTEEKKPKIFESNVKSSYKDNYISNYDNNNNNSLSAIKEESNDLSSFAVNIASYQNMENIIKTELMDKGVLREALRSDFNEDINKDNKSNTYLNVFNKKTTKTEHDIFNELTKITSENKNIEAEQNNNNVAKKQINKDSKIGFNKRKYKEIQNSTLPFQAESAVQTKFFKSK